MNQMPPDPGKSVANEDIVSEIDALGSELRALRHDLHAGLDALHAQLDRVEKVMIDILTKM